MDLGHVGRVLFVVVPNDAWHGVGVFLSAGAAAPFALVPENGARIIVARLDLTEPRTGCKSREHNMVPVNLQSQDHYDQTCRELKKRLEQLEAELFDDPT